MKTIEGMSKNIKGGSTQHIVTMWWICKGGMDVLDIGPVWENSNVRNVFGKEVYLEDDT